MKNLSTIKFMVMALFVAVMSMSFTACSSDDDEDSKTLSSASIVGTWEETGSTTTSYTRMTFNSNGTGYTTTESGTANFKYTFSMDAGAQVGTLKYWYVDSQTIYNREVTITGNTMMLSSSNGVSIWQKK